MRFHEIITPEEPEDVIYFIKENCQPYLSASAYNWIYHGHHRKAFPVNIKTMHQVREPMSMPRDMHEFLNELIDEKGLTANRSNAMFVAGTPLITEHFGLDYDDVSVIFPIGLFNYTWSTVMYDAYDYLVGTYDGDPREDTRIKESFKGDDGSLVQAIRSKHEIMIHANKVLMVKLEFFKERVEPHL